MKTVEENTLRQLPLDFKIQPGMGRGDFMVSVCNSEAFEMVDAWPDWVACGLVIYGPSGCGKSHLAHLFAEKVSDRGLPVTIKTASALNMRNIKKIAEENQVLIVEDVEPENNNEALFHLFNLFNEEGRYMLWTAKEAPARMRFPLKDLQSRLNMLPSVAIKEPDDMMLQMLIVKLFDDRQIIISEEILNYMLNNVRRSFSYIRDLVAEIDKISLACQSGVNYQIVKKAIEVLALKENSQPDLFDER
ncbi:MAG: hypothetical protein J6039_01955 [Alphaproteobacteria bacterium]|nr:hypothetical protein [Alphaproteobacteria bacterium]